MCGGDKGNAYSRRAVIFSLRIGDRYLGEEEVGLSGDAVRGNKEGDVSPKERPRVIKAGVDTVVGAAIGVGFGVALVITARAGITIVIQVAVRIDECSSQSVSSWSERLSL